jgi:hypothetical protein
MGQFSGRHKQFISSTNFLSVQYLVVHFWMPIWFFNREYICSLYDKYYCDLLTAKQCSMNFSKMSALYLFSLATVFCLQNQCFPETSVVSTYFIDGRHFHSRKKIISCPEYMMKIDALLSETLTAWHFLCTPLSKLLETSSICTLLFFPIQEDIKISIPEQKISY